jgi:branched-chain amino acid transport system ATP-binding protein
MSLLKVHDLNVHYGDVHVLHQVGLKVEEGEVITIVGANGAGKSTLLKSIGGIHRASSGEIRFLEERIDQLPSHRIVEKGVIRIPEGRKVFPSMTVLENLELGSYLPEAKTKRGESLGNVFNLFPVLKNRVQQTAGTLSGGEQQMLAIGRGLMALPRLLMLDEPSLGLAPLLVKQIFQTLGEINKRGTTLLLVEQNVYNALDMAQEGYVLETGRIVLSGKSKDLLHNEYIKEAYLGV